VVADVISDYTETVQGVDVICHLDSSVDMWA